jgi:hypothetical protein
MNNSGVRRVETPSGHVVIAHGVATLWRFFSPLGCYALVWPDDEPNLYAILRSVAFVRDGQGATSGPYLYTSTQR